MNSGHLILLAVAIVFAVAWRLDHKDLRRVRRQRDRLWQTRREGTLDRQRVVADLAHVTRERDELAAALDALTGQPAGAFEAAVARHPAQFRVVQGGRA